MQTTTPQPDTPPAATPKPVNPDQAYLTIWDPYGHTWKSTLLKQGDIAQTAPLLLTAYATPATALQLIQGGCINNLATDPQPYGKRIRHLTKWATLYKRFLESGVERMYVLTEYEQWVVHQIKDRETGKVKINRAADLLGLESRYKKDRIQGLEPIDRETALQGDYCLYYCGGSWTMDRVQRDGIFPDFPWLDQWAKHASYWRRGKSGAASNHIDGSAIL